MHNTTTENNKAIEDSWLHHSTQFAATAVKQCGVSSKYAGNMTPIISTCIEISRCSLLLLLLCATAAQFQPCSNRVASHARCADVNTVWIERRLMWVRQTDGQTNRQTPHHYTDTHRLTALFLGQPGSGVARFWGPWRNYTDPAVQ